MIEKECPVCFYKWIPRVENPKACPRCKTRFDQRREKK